MNKVGKFFEIAYLVIAVIIGIEAFNKWPESEAYGYLALAVMAVFMFFFRRNFRKKREDRLNKNQ